MTKLGRRLIASAEEALAIAEGKLKPARIVPAEEIDVASIRRRLKLSQGKFAERFHLSAATVRDWEQKRRSPGRIASNLLRVIEHSPETVERALSRGTSRVERPGGRSPRRVDRRHA